MWKSTSELGYGQRRVDGVGRLKFDFRTGPGPLRHRLPLLAMRLGRDFRGKLVSCQKRDRTINIVIVAKRVDLRPLQGRFGCRGCRP